eukprot:5640416-Pyramimonas_sp.AAC.1
MSGMGSRIQCGLSSYAVPWVRCGAASAPANVAPRYCGRGQALRSETGPSGGGQVVRGAGHADQEGR